MGYFLEYENFTTCWHCGRTDCTGNHPEVKEKPVHLEKGFGHTDCECRVCRDMREREANRKLN
jgi:hypothetical protein